MFCNTTRQLNDPGRVPQVGGKLLVHVYQFLTSNSNFKQHQIFKTPYFRNFTDPLRKTIFSQIYQKTFTKNPAT